MWKDQRVKKNVCLFIIKAWSLAGEENRNHLQSDNEVKDWGLWREQMLLNCCLTLLIVTKDFCRLPALCGCFAEVGWGTGWVQSCCGEGDIRVCCIFFLSVLQGSVGSTQIWGLAGKGFRVPERVWNVEFMGKVFKYCERNFKTFISLYEPLVFWC